MAAFLRRHSQVVRQRPAKPLYSGSNPDAASNSFLSPSLFPHGGFSAESRPSHTDTSPRASGGIGIHDGLKIRSPQGDAGSIPASPTTFFPCPARGIRSGAHLLPRTHEKTLRFPSGQFCDALVFPRFLRVSSTVAQYFPSFPSDRSAW